MDAVILDSETRAAARRGPVVLVLGRKCCRRYVKRVSACRSSSPTPWSGRSTWSAPTHTWWCACTGRRASPKRCRASTPSMAAATSSAATTWTTLASTATARCFRASGSRSSTGSRPRLPIPGPLEDCYAGLKWTYEHSEELGIDAERIGIAGISAGGGLAAALALLARDRGEVPLDLPAPRVPHDRRPPGHVLEPARRAPDLEPRLERVRLAELPRRSLRQRRHSDLRGGRRVPPTCPASRLHSSSSAGPTASATKTSTTRCASINAACRRSCTCCPGAPHGVQMFAGSVVARRWDAIVTDWLALQLNR